MSAQHKTVIAVVVFAVLLLIVILVRRDPYEHKPETPLPTLPTFDTALIDKVEIINKDEALTFSLKGENWWITQPKELLANDTFSALVVEKLGNIELERIVSDNPNTHETFEVDDSGTRLTAYSKGETKLTLIVGKSTPDYRGTFVRLPDSGAVYATKRVIGGSLQKDMAYWRDKTLLKLERPDIEEITYAQGNKTFTLSLLPPQPNPDEAEGAPSIQATWVFTDDANTSVDQDRVNTTLSTVSMLTWAEIIDEPGDLAGYGLAQPNGRLTLKTKDGVSHSLLIGKLTDDEQMAYVMREDNPAVFQIRKFQYERLTKDRSFYKGE